MRKQYYRKIVKETESHTKFLKIGTLSKILIISENVISKSYTIDSNLLSSDDYKTFSPKMTLIFTSKPMNIQTVR